MTSKGLRKAIDIESDLLIDNRNRMCVCNEMLELDEQFVVACKRLVNLHTLNMQRLREKRFGHE